MHNDFVLRKLYTVLITVIIGISVAGCGNSAVEDSDLQSGLVCDAPVSSYVSKNKTKISGTINLPKKNNTKTSDADASKGIDSSNGSASVTSDEMSDTINIFNPEYFDDDNFRQLNVTVYVPELYKLDSFNREIKANGTYTAYDDSVDLSHIETAYIAPVLSDGTTYMSIYDYTYAYSDDRMTEAFMNLIADDISLRNKLMLASEYTELVDVY